MTPRKPGFRARDNKLGVQDQLGTDATVPDAVGRSNSCLTHSDEHSYLRLRMSVGL